MAFGRSRDKIQAKVIVIVELSKQNTTMYCNLSFHLAGTVSEHDI